MIPATDERSGNAVVNAAVPPESPPPKPNSKRKNIDKPPRLPESFRSARLRQMHERRQESTLAEGSGPQAMRGTKSSTTPDIPTAAASRGGIKKRGLISPSFSVCVVNLTSPAVKSQVKLPDDASSTKQLSAQLSSSIPPPLAPPRRLSAPESADNKMSDGDPAGLAVKSRGESAQGMRTQCLVMLRSLNSQLSQDTQSRMESLLPTYDLTTNLPVNDLENIPAHDPATIGQNKPVHVSGDVSRSPTADVTPAVAPENAPDNVQENVRVNVEGYVQANDTRYVSANVYAPILAGGSKSGPKPIPYVPENNPTIAPQQMPMLSPLTQTVVPSAPASIPPSVPARIATSAPVSISSQTIGYVSQLITVKAPIPIISNVSPTMSTGAIPSITVNSIPCVPGSSLEYGEPNARAHGLTNS